MRGRLLSVLLMCAFVGGVARADEIDDAIAGLTKAIKEKAKPDIRHFAKLTADKFATAKPEQQKEILKLTGMALGVSDQDTKDFVIDLLPQTDARASSILLKEIDKKTTEDEQKYFEKCVKTLGKVKDPKEGLAKLRKLLYHKSNDIIAAAADGLSNYKDSDLETKKGIVDDLLKIWGSAVSAAKNPRDTTSKNKAERLKGPMNESLKTLTGQTNDGFEAWLKWYNDTGKKATKW